MKKGFTIIILWAVLSQASCPSSKVPSSHVTPRDPRDRYVTYAVRGVICALAFSNDALSPKRLLPEDLATSFVHTVDLRSGIDIDVFI